MRKSKDDEGSQSTEVGEMQNCKNWEDDGTILIIVNHFVNENSNVNNFVERTIAEENGQMFSDQNQIQSHQS